MGKYNYITVVSRFKFYNVHFQKLLLFGDNEGQQLEITAGDSNEWGKPSILNMDSPETYSLPARIEFRWITASENYCFEISESLDQAKAEELWVKQQKEFPDDLFKQYIVGIAPYGGVAIWLCSNNRSVLLQWLKAEEQFLTEEESLVYTPHPEREKLVNMLMPPEKLQSIMRQHLYRLVPMEEYFDEGKWKRFDSTNIHYEGIALDSVEVERFDGTFDHSGSEAMMRYHVAGKPKKIIVNWHEGKDSYFAQFKLDETMAIDFFDGFFDAFPDAKADLLIRIDTRAKRFEIAMTGEGLAVIPIKYTQYIVYKGNEEFCRSENYVEDPIFDDEDDDDDED